MIDHGDGVLPDKIFFGCFWSKVSTARSHVAVCELEPRPGKRVLKFVWIFQESPRNFSIGRIKTQREVGSQHCWGMALGGVVSIWNLIGSGSILWCPLV